MRTKHYLAALCVPMAFAACSNEEFVNETPALGSRGTVNVTLSAEKTSSWGVDTRMTIDENNRFVWEKDVDNIGAAMADGATFGTIQNEVLVNYPFTANNTGNASDFNAKSAIAQGNYLFYYGYTDVLDRGMLNLGVPAQTYNVAETKTPIQQAANQMKMISPIIELADGVAYKDAQEYKLNLSFVNLYTMVKVVVSSKNFPDGVVPTLKKISLNATGADGNTIQGFATIANVDLTVIAGAANANANVVAPEKDGTLDEDKMAVANKAINALINNATGAAASTVYQTEDAVYGPATLAVEGSLSLNATEEVILYILAPKGDYTETGLTLDIETSEGNYTKAFKVTSPAKMILGDGIQPLTADLNFDADNGNVTLPLVFKIASAADWTTANAFVASHALSYVDKTVTLNLIEDIEVAALPKFNATITGAKKLTLSGASAIKSDPAIVAGTVSMIVKAGATLTLDAKAVFAKIENNGTLVVNADQDKAIQNNGTMNVQKDATLSGGVTNGAAETLTDDAIAGTINIAGKKLTIGTTALINEVGEVNILAKSELIGVAGMVVNKAIINNFGVQNALITNADGTVNIEKGSTSAAGKTITDGTAVVKDIAEYSGLAAAKRHVFANAVVVTSVSNAGLYGKANTTGLGITNVVLDGGDWTLANAKGGDATKIIVAPTTTVTDLTLAAANLTFDGVATLAKNISAEGASSISVKGIVETVITGALTVKEAATLTANTLVTFNELKTSNDKVATILGTLNVEAGAKLYFNTATVGSADVAGAKLNVKGNVKGIATGEFGIQSQTGFDNYGTVSSLAGSDKFPAAGKVSQPKNIGSTATFKGNASTFTFVA